MDLNRTNSHSPSHSGVSPEIDQLGRDFVTAWLADETRRIESFLGDLPESLRREACDVLIRLEIYLRSSKGEKLQADEYRKRFPDFGSVVESAILSDEDSITANYESVHNSVEASGIGIASEFDVVPEQFGRYEVKQVLGTGGFGIVCLAFDTQLDRHVALKFARTSRFQNPQEMENLIREAQTAAQLDHPGIVAVHDVIQQDDFIGIIQQLIDGRDLREEIEAHPPSVERAAELLIAICSGVAFAHAKGFVHRDFKARQHSDRQKRQSPHFRFWPGHS